MDDRGCTNRSDNSINKEVDILLGPQDFEVSMLPIIKVSPITVHAVRKSFLLFDSLRYEIKQALDLGSFASTDDPMSTKKSFCWCIVFLLRNVNQLSYSVSGLFNVTLI